MVSYLDFTVPVEFMSSDVSTVTIPLGITIGLLASFIQSLGLTIQRKSHVQNQALPEDQQKLEHRRPLWLLGFAIFISSNLFGSLVQIASLPVVILAPLGAVSLLWNAFFARMLLGDAFSIWMVLGTLLIAGGAVLIAVFGVVPEPTHSLEDLLVLFSRPAFVVYFSLLGTFVGTCLATTHALEYSYSRRVGIQSTVPPPSPHLTTDTVPTFPTTPTVVANLTPGPFTERTPLIDNKVSRPTSPSDVESLTSSLRPPLTWSERMPTLLAMSYASFSGVISGMCLLFAKSGVELLVLTLAGKNQFWRWQAWVLVLGLVACALLQLWYMHKGLVLASPTLICPLAFCFYNISSIVNGLVYFDQFSLLSTTHLSLVMLGMIILLAGVWIVSLPPSGGIGVDITRWDEQQENARREQSMINEVYDDEPLPMVPQRIPYTEPSTLTLDSHTSDIDTHAGLGLVLGGDTSDRDPSRVQVSSTIAHTHRQTYSDLPLQKKSSPSQQTSPVEDHPRATSTLPLSSSITSQNVPPPHIAAHQRQSSQSFGYSFPLSPGATPGTLGGGFSIGLSPISPGFALVPRRKRRRTGSSATEGLSPTLADNGRNMARGFRDSTSMRRVVSDSGVHSPPRSFEGERTRLLNDEGRQGSIFSESQRGHSPSGVSRSRVHAKSRWRWLRGVFAFGG